MHSLKQTTITDLPVELIWEIAEVVHPRDYDNFRGTCKWFHAFDKIPTLNFKTYKMVVRSASSADLRLMGDNHLMKLRTSDVTRDSFAFLANQEHVNELERITTSHPGLIHLWDEKSRDEFIEGVYFGRKRQYLPMDTMH